MNGINRLETLSAILKHHAIERPHSTAIQAPGRSLMSFLSLWSNIKQITDALRQAGIERDAPVAVVLPNGSEMAVVVLGVACVAICAPLNPGYKTAEFEFYLSDLEASALILEHTDNSAARDVALAMGIPIFNLSTDGDECFSLESSESCRQSVGEPTEAMADDIALVLHTSGTTSRPKQVPLTHKNLVASAYHITETLQLTVNDCCLNMMPLFHIHGLIAGLLSPLVSGGSVVCSPGFIADSFFQWLGEFNPTWYTAVPTIHQAVLQSIEHDFSNNPYKSLRFIRSSSAALPSQVMQQLEQVFHCPVIEAYGMTEAAHQMSSNPLPPAQRKPRSVGLAAGPEVAIMNERNEIVTDGQMGEIVICGDNVTTGYKNNQEANAGAFSQGWFRTGDQGYLDNDRYLFITGRLKEMINRGGEKIAPSEIDDVLTEHLEIFQAVAFAVTHPTLGEDVAAAVVLRPDSKVTEQEIRAFAFERLVGYKVPSHVIIVEEIPKGATGKIQRIGLAEKLAPALKAKYVAPMNDLQFIVAEIWMEVLRLEHIGIEDNFFSIGGDSITATQIISRLHAIFPLTLPIATMFRKPTIVELTEEITGFIDEKDLSEIITLMTEIENLDEEEAQRLLDLELKNSD